MLSYATGGAAWDNDGGFSFEHTLIAYRQL